jgi:hypothetical protein
LSTSRTRRRYVINGRQAVMSDYVINCIARWKKVRDRATGVGLCIRTGRHRSDEWIDPSTVAIRRQLRGLVK